jgi:hypothetical protein
VFDKHEFTADYRQLSNEEIDEQCARRPETALRMGAKAFPEPNHYDRNLQRRSTWRRGH